MPNLRGGQDGCGRDGEDPPALTEARGGAESRGSKRSIYETDPFTETDPFIDPFIWREETHAIVWYFPLYLERSGGFLSYVLKMLAAQRVLGRYNLVHMR